MERSSLQFLFGKSTTTATVVDEAPGEEVIPYKIPMKIIERVMDNRYEGDGIVHPGDHLLFLHELCGLFKCAGISMNEVRKKLFTISLSGKAAHWYKLLKNGDSIDWEDIVPFFYSKFYPPSEIHKDRNRIYNFWPHDGESIAQAWRRLKSLMLKCPIHELPGNVIIDNFYARLSFQDKTLLDTSCSGSFTRNKEEFKWDLLDRIQENTEGWENDKGRESGINYDYECIETFMDTDKFRNMSATYGLDSQVAANLYKAFASHIELPRKNFDKYHEPFKDTCMNNETVINVCNEHVQTSENAISYKHVNFCGMHRPCGINQIEDEYCIHHMNEKTRKWSRALDDLGKKVCALYPFICEVCHEVGHFNFQCSSNDNLNPISAANLYCDDEIIPNQHDELTLFLGCEELSRKISLLQISDLDIDDVLHGCFSYCINNSHTNTYIQNILEDDTLPKYDRTAVCFQLINEKEGSSQVSSIVSKSKSGYADKPPFKPLPPKEGNEKKEEKKKKKKGTKKKKKKENKKKEVTAYPRVNEITLGNRKYVAPNDYYDNESEYDDLPMPFTYISDHDLGEHTTFDIENLWETNSENEDVNNCQSINT